MPAILARRLAKQMGADCPEERQTDQKGTPPGPAWQKGKGRTSAQRRNFLLPKNLHSRSRSSPILPLPPKNELKLDDS